MGSVCRAKIMLIFKIKCDIISLSYHKEAFMSFTVGELFHIEMRNGIYQVLGLYGSDDKGEVYYFRKVFDGKLNFKLSKATIVHESWMSRISEKTREKISASLALPEVQAALNDLTIDRMMEFGAELRLEIVLCTMDPKNKRRLEKQLNAQAGGNINTYLMRDAIRELQSSGELQIEDSLVYPPDGKRLYRVELGRYCDDFDEFKNKIYREIRFTEVKMYKREDLV
jgi:hypothetical protein